ncbi:MAG: hypothetical protein U0L51_02510 [Olegusella sp.]|nr:hypothetical protein [Olegusella sp.]
MTMIYGARDEGPRQRFVEVDVRHTLDGMLIPLRINWSDGRTFEIAEYHFDGMDHAANARRWAVRIKGHRAFTQLWLASSGRFFVMEKARRPDTTDF